jgi:hypothetical protein
MPYSKVEITEYSRKIGKSVPTLWRWVRQGCDLRDPKSVREWVTRNTIRKTNISKARKRRRDNEEKAQRTFPVPPSNAFEFTGNGHLPPPGKRGAAAALERLETAEERAQARLQAALERGDPFQTQATQEFWLKCSETLRRLDLAVELARRDQEQQVPKKLACDVALYISDWFRISFAQFLSSEANVILGLKDVGELKAHCFRQFVSILHLTVRNSLKTGSPIPDWAVEKIRESWNVSDE